MRRDLLGRIADARASMMLRGHHVLQLVIGADTRARLGHELGAADGAKIDEALASIGLPETIVRDEMEGFLVMAISRPGTTPAVAR